jgi:hypothetical protein
MPVATTPPTLPQVQSLDTAYLSEAAEYFERTGNLRDEVFTEIHERMSAPGGTLWKGQAGTAEQERALTDMLNVRSECYRLLEAAGVARRGDAKLQGCKEGVLEAVREARAAGFEVGEDYSVTDRFQGGSTEFRAERLTQAKAQAAYIRHQVALLVANDQEITAQITAATRGVDNLTFTESPGADDTIVADDKHNWVQPVDHHWKQSPDQPGPTHAPGADDIRGVLDKLPQGSNPRIREVRTQQDLDNLWNWMKQKRS